MKKTLLLSTYYNAPHFLELQQQSFNLFMNDEFDFYIFDDSDDNTQAILSGIHARTSIIDECDRLNIIRIPVPQSVHACVKDGGLVPDGLPASHPTERHRACLHWILKDGFKKLNISDYDAVVLMESDMMLRRSVSFINILNHHDLLGTGKKNRTMVNRRDPDQFWPERIADLDEITIDHFNMMLTIFNPNIVSDIDEMDIGGFAGTDTGGKTHFFMSDRDYRCNFLHVFNDLDKQVDLFAIDDVSNPEFVHYRAGSNWDYQSVEYYKEKLNRMLNEYIPDMGNRPESDKKLTSRDGEHTFE